METFLNLFLIAAALGGFVLAFFIFISKRKAKPIACPMDGHCDDVVRSEFSKFFGVPVEILGMLYYAVAAAAYSVFYFDLKPIACPMDGHCDDVVRSEFSKFFGVPVEILGMLYYAVAAAAYSVFYFYSGLAVPLAVFGMFGLASFSFLFSLYLTFIQAFNLKQWCVWCLASAGLSSFIFLANVFYVNFFFSV